MSKSTKSIARGNGGSWNNAKSISGGDTGVHSMGGDEAKAKAGGDANTRGLGNLEGYTKGGG